MSARCWKRRRVRARFDIAIRRVVKDPYLSVPLTDTVVIVGIARWSELS